MGWIEGVRIRRQEQQSYRQNNYQQQQQNGNNASVFDQAKNARAGGNQQADQYPQSTNPSQQGANTGTINPNQHRLSSNQQQQRTGAETQASAQDQQKTINNQQSNSAQSSSNGYYDNSGRYHFTSGENKGGMSYEDKKTPGNFFHQSAKGDWFYGNDKGWKKYNQDKKQWEPQQTTSQNQASQNSPSITDNKPAQSTKPDISEIAKKYTKTSTPISRGVGTYENAAQEALQALQPQLDQVADRVNQDLVQQGGLDQTFKDTADKNGLASLAGGKGRQELEQALAQKVQEYMKNSGNMDGITQQAEAQAKQAVKSRLTDQKAINVANGKGPFGLRPLRPGRFADRQRAQSEAQARAAMNPIMQSAITDYMNQKLKPDIEARMTSLGTKQAASQVGQVVSETAESASNFLSSLRRRLNEAAAN